MRKIVRMRKRFAIVGRKADTVIIREVHTDGSLGREYEVYKEIFNATYETVEEDE